MTELLETGGEVADQHVVELILEKEAIKRRLGEIVIQLSSLDTETQKAAYKAAFPNK
jgi:hypothetical protein